MDQPEDGSDESGEPSEEQVDDNASGDQTSEMSTEELMEMFEKECCKKTTQQFFVVFFYK